MGAQRAAWLASFEAEQANAKGHDQAAALLDLVKAFEMVPHHLLAQAAKEAGYSIRILRMSLAAYRIARSIGVDGVYSKQVTAARGITAGSGMATTELRLLLTELVYLLRKTWPVAIKLYVDDLTITASGKGLAAATAAAEAADFAVQSFQKLGLEVSVKKSVAIANRPKVLSTMLQRCKSGALTAAKSAKLLGTSFTAGSMRSVTVLRSRI
jgi:hypothetical protein